MSNITDTIDMGATTHNMRLVIPERFCSADISSEGNTKDHWHTARCGFSPSQAICLSLLNGRGTKPPVAWRKDPQRPCLRNLASACLPPFEPLHPGVAG